MTKISKPYKVEKKVSMLCSMATLPEECQYNVCVTLGGGCPYNVCDTLRGGCPYNVCVLP